MKKILVVDDEPLTHQLVSAVLRVLGDVEILTAMNGTQGLTLARDRLPDLIISDLNMPDMDGLALTQQVRATPALAHVPILLLTARGEQADKYEGFLHGADDYLTKPFDIMELQLRIKALLRRRAEPEPVEGAPPEAGLTAGPVSLEPGKLLVRYLGQEVRLTGTEFAIMRYFVTHPDRLVPAEALLSGALEYPAGVGNPQAIHTHIKNLRAKFRQAGAELTCLTSSWQGYLLATEPPAE